MNNVSSLDKFKNRLRRYVVNANGLIKIEAELIVDARDEGDALDAYFKAFSLKQQERLVNLTINPLDIEKDAAIIQALNLTDGKKSYTTSFGEKGDVVVRLVFSSTGKVNKKESLAKFSEMLDENF